MGEGSIEGLVEGWTGFSNVQRFRRFRYGVNGDVVMPSGLTRRLARETEANVKDVVGHI